MKKLIILIAIIIVAIITVFCFLKFSKFDLGNPFKAKPITIDKTANVVEEINQLAEFTTATYFQEIFINKVRKGTFFDDELVLITKGKVRAGFDLLTLTEEDIVVEGNTIKLKLPEVKILEIITNPSDFETYVESGKWSFDEVNEYKKEAREKLEQLAIEGGILELAEKSAFEKLSSLFQILGFQEIIIE
jgi:hypothetical protein